MMPFVNFTQRGNRLDNKKQAGFAVGSVIKCKVIEHAPFGVLVAIGDKLTSGIVERIRMEQDGFNTPDDYPPVGSTVNATVLGIREWSNQVELALLTGETPWQKS